MPIYDIAGLKVSLSGCEGRTEKQALPYLSEKQDEKADIEINITKELLSLHRGPDSKESDDDWIYMLSGSEFYGKLTSYGGILLHSSCIVLDGVAYAFSADSGTGKTTHAKLWLEHFKSRAHMLNDDKPAIRIIDGKVYACGTPWSGQTDWSTPEIAPLGAICFIKRSEKCYIKRADTAAALHSVFEQTIRYVGKSAMENILDILDRLFNSVPVFELGCNISDEAVITAYNGIVRSHNEHK